MAEEVLMRQAKVLARRSRQSLEAARQAVSHTEAGRKLRELANGEHRHEKAQDWQASVFWGRAEERSMHLYWVEPLIVLASIALEKVASTLDPIGTSFAPFPGATLVTVGGVVSGLPGAP